MSLSKGKKIAAINFHTINQTKNTLNYTEIPFNNRVKKMSGLITELRNFDSQGHRFTIKLSKPTAFEVSCKKNFSIIY